VTDLIRKAQAEALREAAQEMALVSNPGTVGARWASWLRKRADALSQQPGPSRLTAEERAERWFRSDDGPRVVRSKDGEPAGTLEWAIAANLSALAAEIRDAEAAATR
jgi:hypothetical protein